MTKILFCAVCQDDTTHTIDILPHEIVCTCDCGHPIKFPPSKDAGVLRAMFDRHRAANLGQIPAVEYKPDVDVASAIENA